MRVLMIHSYYRQRGGEDAIFEQESQLIGQSEEVQTLVFRNEEGRRGALQFFASIWNRSAAARLKKAIHAFRPDIIHIHNFHFGTGPLIIRTARRHGIPVVCTINNYRLLCPSATFLHDGQLFTDSIHASFPWKAVSKKVYRNSTLLTFWLAFIIWFHKKTGTWKKVDRFIVNTDFAKSIFENSSLAIPAGKIVVKPNFVAPPPFDSPLKGDHLLFVGRLSPEKGIPLLIEAFSETNHTLHIAGDGPLKELVDKASRQHANIKFLGLLNKTQVQEAMMECKALVFPSIWYEGMPMTIVEAFAAGVPVIASNLGAMASMIRHGYNGLHFEAGDSAGLKEQLNAWHNLDKEQIKTYRENVLDTYNTCYTAEKNKNSLLTIYKNLLTCKNN